MTTIPTLTTDRLTLRPPTTADFPAYAEILKSDRSIYMGGPFSEESAWLDICAGVAGWHLHGYGIWTITPRSGEQYLGTIYLHQEFGDPERELGWILIKDAEGKGYAREAAFAVRRYAYDILGWQTVVSYIDPANVRSINLATKMGAAVDPNAEIFATEDPVLVYRHPAPEAIQ